MKKRLFILLLSFMLFSACSGEKAAIPSAPYQSKAARPLEFKAGAPSEWDRILEEAKKEGRVVVYTGAGSGETRLLYEAFKKRYGIEAEFLSGRGGELFVKVNSERRAGLYLPDVYFSGTTTTLNQFKPAGFLDSLKSVLVLPEVADPNMWFEKKLPFVDKEGEYIFAAQAAPAQSMVFNKDMARLEEIGSYKALLNPRWKGKIMINDPTISGSGETFFAVSVEYYTGIDYWRDFVKAQLPVVMRDQRLLVEWVARGRYAVALAGASGPDEEFIRAGAPIERTNPEEGGYLSTGFAGISLMTKAPHPNTARVFINWFLGKEGQTVYGNASDRQSARVDVPLDQIPLSAQRVPGKKYISAETEAFKSKKDEYHRLAVEIFGPLMK